jgi:hypothetical protein
MDVLNHTRHSMWYTIILNITRRRHTSDEKKLASLVIPGIFGNLSAAPWLTRTDKFSLAVNSVARSTSCVFLEPISNRTLLP